MRSGVIRGVNQTIAGEKRNDRIYLVCEARIRVLVTSDSFTKGGNLDADAFELKLRESCADHLVGVTFDDMLIDQVNISEFKPGQP